MIALGIVGVFLIALAISVFVFKVLPLARTLRKWHIGLDDKFPHFPIHWLWGNLKQIKSIKAFFEDTMVLLKDGSQAYMFWIGFYRPIVVAAHHESVKAILKTSEPKAKGGGGYEFLLPWLGDGLLVSDGKKWERNRRLLTPAFHFDILQPYVRVYNQVAQTFMKNLESQSKGGNSVEVFAPAGLATLDTMLQCSLSYKDDIQEKGQSHPYVKAVIRLSNLIMARSLNILHYIPFIYNLSANGKEFAKLCQYVHKFSEDIIMARKKALESDPELLNKRRLDFLDILLSARDDAGQGLTDQEIRDEVDTFMFEGHDTTSSAISWCLYTLAKYPAEQQKVLQDVQQAVGDKNEVEWDDLAKLKYLPMFIRESMRLFPPVPVVSRQLSQSLVIDGVQIPKGVIVDINMYQMHRNANVWPNPMEFDTERFSLDRAAGRDPYCFVPFSAGPRNCIGQNFAVNEIKVMLCQVVRRFHIEVDPAKPAVPSPEVVLRAENGLYLKFSGRKNT
ncbi:cytochrome P450 4B1-like [Haliotis rufescens]|uniref:cytochrome P450 4B1-like n=1 Tax=Haliotis rufescens TaxID=6454 RepID=UPI00201F723E|nr:cytochrome P450 4B1-like [Haliotis rufescens]